MPLSDLITSASFLGRLETVHVSIPVSFISVISANTILRPTTFRQTASSSLSTCRRLTQYPSHFKLQARLSTSLCQQLNSVHTSSLNLSSHIFTPLSYLIVSLSHRKVTWRWRSTSAEKGCCHERSSLRHSARLDEQPVLAAGKARIWHAPCRHVFGMTGPLTRQLLGGMSWIVVLEML